LKHDLEVGVCDPEHSTKQLHKPFSGKALREHEGCGDALRTTDNKSPYHSLKPEKKEGQSSPYWQCAMKDPALEVPLT